MSGKLARLGALAFVALAGTAGAAFATGALSGVVGADGSIQGCYQKNNGQLRVVRAASECRPSEVPLRWNQKGQQGIQGPQGLAGARGATGPQGPTGEQGPQGEQGERGESLTAMPFGPGSARCDGRAGLVISSESGEVFGAVCDGADGEDGADGQDGAPGGAIVGSACSRPNGDAGTIQMSVGATGAISFTCQTSGGGGGEDLCPNPLPSYPNSTTTCAAATGEVHITCDPGFFDVNLDLADGCEVNAPGTEEECNGIDDDGDGQIDEGTGGQPIAGGNGVLMCQNGVLVALCDVGFAGANCQINVMTDVANCGAVGNAPPPAPHVVTWQCVAGQHTIAGCETGWRDVNGSIVDGCEASVDTNPAGSTQSTATYLGAGLRDCDVTTGFNGMLAAVESGGGEDNDWFSIDVTDDVFCTMQLVVTFSCGGCTNVAYDVITEDDVRLNQHGPLTLPMETGGGNNDSQTVFFRIHRDGAAITNPIAYSVSFHF